MKLFSIQQVCHLVSPRNKYYMDNAFFRDRYDNIYMHSHEKSIPNTHVSFCGTYRGLMSVFNIPFDKLSPYFQTRISNIDW